MAKKDEGYLLDSDGNRVKSGSGEYMRTGSYDDEKVTQNRIKAAEEKLAQDVQDKLKADKAKAPASTKPAAPKAAVDIDESDRRKEAAANAPKTNQGAAKPKSGVVTKEELAKSGLSLRDYMNKQKGLTRRDGKAPDAAKPATTTSEPAAKPSKPAGASGLLDPQQKAQQKAQPSKPETSAGKSIFQRIAEKETMADRIRQRGEDDLKSRGMKAGGSVKMAKGSSINGIAKRGLTKCKMR